MLQGTPWLGALISFFLIFFTTIPVTYSETASCQKNENGVFECLQLSMDGPLSQDNCWMNQKLVEGPCPADNLIAACTYEMGVSFAVKSAEGGYQPGPVHPLKYQVNCYSDKSGNDTKKLEACREQCRGLEGDFSTTVAQKP